MEIRYKRTYLPAKGKRYTAGEIQGMLGYAVEAGLDFFAYCWYPDGEEDDFWRNEAEYSFLAPHFSELNHAREMYQKSPLREKIKMCAIIFCVHGYSESDIEKLYNNKVLQDDKSQIDQYYEILGISSNANKNEIKTFNYYIDKSYI